MFTVLHLLTSQAVAQPVPPPGLVPVWAADDEFCIGEQDEAVDWATALGSINAGLTDYVNIEPGMVIQLSSVLKVNSTLTLAVEGCDGSTGTATIIAPNGGRIFDVTSATLTVTQDLTLTGSVAQVTGNGGTIKSNGGTLKLYGPISGGNASADGGVVWMNGGRLELYGTLSGGVAGDDGGCLWANGADLDLHDQAEIHDCVAADQGGGAFVNQSSLDAVASALGTLKLRDNQADSGGGAYLYLSSVNLDGVDVGSNVASSEGGGLFLGTTGGAQVTLTNVRVHDNELQPTSGSAQGAGIYAMAATFTMGSDTTTCEPFPLTEDVFCSEVRDNTGADAGGGMYVSSGSTPTLKSTAFFANESGALYVDQSQVYGEGLIVADHTTWKGAPGSTIDADGWSTLQLYYSTIADNAATGIRYTPASAGVPGTAGELYANIVRNDVAGSPAGNENLLLDVSQVTGVNYIDDPQFLTGERCRFDVDDTSAAHLNAPAPLPGQFGTDIDGASRGTPWTRGALQALPSGP